MVLNKDWTEALDALYFAVGKPDLWNQALDSLCDVLQADTALLFTPCPQLLDFPYHYSKRYSIDTIHDYLQNFIIEDPYNASASSRDQFKMGIVCTGDDLVPMSYMQTTRFFKEFSLKHNQGHLLVGLLFGLDNPFELPAIVLSFYRPIHQPGFGQDEVVTLKKMLPHIQRAWLLHDELLKTKALNFYLQGALNHVSQGLIILNAERKMLFANATSKRFLSHMYLSELKTKKDELIALPKSILDIAKVASGDKLTCRKVQLNQNEEWFIVAAPVKKIPYLNSHQNDQSIMLWLTQNNQVGKNSACLMEELFKLTASESSTLRLLLSSHSPQEIATTLDVRISTIRSHLASILAKTGAKRQQDLILMSSVFDFIHTI